jgi:cell division protease FtsH
VRNWGMSENLGLLSYANSDEQIFLGREIVQHRDYSEATAQKIDEEIVHLIKKSYSKAREVINKNLDVLHKLSDLLLEKETVLGPELDDLLRSMRPGIQLSFPKDDNNNPVVEKTTESVPDAPGATGDHGDTA